MDERFMREALSLAERAASEGEVPVGAVIVYNGEIIASGYNRRESDKNALAHAEIIAIDAACKARGGWRLSGCTLYVTLEPCLMCAGAIVNARIDRVVYALPDPKSGAFGSVTDVSELPVNHHPEVTNGVLAEPCKEVLQSFFKKLRKK